MLAPPWFPVPSPHYGGIEEVVRLLARELVRRGHEVALFAPPGTRSEAHVVPVLDEPKPERIEHSLVEAEHVGAAFDAIDAARAEGRPFAVVHDHCPAVALAMAERLHEPVVHTLHGPFADERRELYLRHGHKAHLVALSESQRQDAPAGVEVEDVVPNPIDLDEWPYRAEKDEALLFIGRLDPDKGPHRAVAAAQAAGRPLVLAGPVQPGWEEYFATTVEPHLDDDIRYVGPLDGDEKRDAFARAAALLMPIAWPEPFGLVMVEALATGTPVIAFRRGAACEIVEDGRNGFLVEDEDEMAEAIGHLGEIDPAACRASVEHRYDAATVAEAYERVFRRSVAAGAREREDLAAR
jgi:glycosyltransferase involved in cell wall biosynthesis